VAIDLPGHCRTPGMAADWTLERLTRRLEQLIGHLGNGPVKFLGLSVGDIFGKALTLAQLDWARLLLPIITTDSLTKAGCAPMRD